MKRIYESPMMFAESFIANQYVAACTKNQEYGYDPSNPPTVTTVTCESPGHNNTQTIDMFTDSQTSCVAKFVPNVGTSNTATQTFKTQFNACAYVDGCNKQTWLAAHPNDTNFTTHASQHKSNRYGPNNGAFIEHDTSISLDLALQFNLS